MIPPPERTIALASTLSPKRVAVLVSAGVVSLTVACWLMINYVILPMMRGSGPCPHCHSPRIRPGWPRVSDKILFWLKPFRCEACNQRFYLGRWAKPAERRVRAAAAGR